MPFHYTPAQHTVIRKALITHDLIEHRVRNQRLFTDVLRSLNVNILVVGLAWMRTQLEGLTNGTHAIERFLQIDGWDICIDAGGFYLLCCKTQRSIHTTNNRFLLWSVC